MSIDTLQDVLPIPIGIPQYLHAGLAERLYRYLRDTEAIVDPAERVFAQTVGRLTIEEAVEGLQIFLDVASVEQFFLRCASIKGIEVPEGFKLESGQVLINTGRIQDLESALRACLHKGC